MNTLLNAMKNETNFSRTTNGALAHKSTLNAVYDMFAFGGAYRLRSDADVLTLFSKAFIESPTYALKCLFYLRDIRGGQGERRFFRLCVKWLAKNYPEVIKRNIPNFPEYGRWDDLYELVGTPCENEAFNFMKNQLELDSTCKTPSLLAKWLKSENASSKETQRLGTLTRSHFNMSPRQYRKALSTLRSRINIVEKLMSENRWDEIEFDKLPSKAGLIYKNAFARRDIIAEKYKKFASDKDTKVNATTLYPYEVVEKAIQARHGSPTDRNIVNKYWENLEDYFDDATLNALAMVDTSGSMTWGSSPRPIDVAISLGLYCAERAKGPFANHYISFSSMPQLIECSGYDFCDKVFRIYKTNLCSNTNLEKAFDMILNVAKYNHLKQSDLPEKIIVISDMQIDLMTVNGEPSLTDMERLRLSWAYEGYKMPKLVYWNVNATQDTVLDGANGVTYVSGCSPVIFDMIMTGKTGIDMMKEKLDGDRYKEIY